LLQSKRKKWSNTVYFTFVKLNRSATNQNHVLKPFIFCDTATLSTASNYDYHNKNSGGTLGLDEALNGPMQLCKAVAQVMKSEERKDKIQ
jgi:hypothetical protein